MFRKWGILGDWICCEWFHDVVSSNQWLLRFTQLWCTQCVMLWGVLLEPRFLPEERATAPKSSRSQIVCARSQTLSQVKDMGQHCGKGYCHRLPEIFSGCPDQATLLWAFLLVCPHHRLTLVTFSLSIAEVAHGWHPHAGVQVCAGRLASTRTNQLAFYKR